MKLEIKFLLVIISLGLFSCVSIPKETVRLSKVLGNDLIILHNSHRNIIELYYGKIENDINTFIDEVYSPFVIHYVLKVELDKYKKGKTSLYGSIENAGKVGGKKETDEALNVMLEFQEAANSQIKVKRDELLNPILKQEKEVISNINKSYENAIYANSTITGYLESIRKVKESQKEALSIVGLKGVDTLLTNTLMEVSELVNSAVKEGKMIDIKSDKAYSQIEEISKKIKKIINKN
jgi:hypothetical protein